MRRRLLPVGIFNPPSSPSPNLFSPQPPSLRAAGRNSFFHPVSGHRPLPARRVPILLPEQHNYTEVKSCVSPTHQSELALAWPSSHTARHNHSQQSPLSGHFFHTFQATASSAAAGLDGGYSSSTSPSDPLHGAAALPNMSTTDLTFDFSHDFSNSVSSSDDFSFDTTQLPTTCGSFTDPSLTQFAGFDLQDGGPASLGPYSSITSLGPLDEPLEALAMSVSSSDDGSSSLMSAQYGADSGASSAHARPSPASQQPQSQLQQQQQEPWPTNQPMAGRLRLVRPPTEDDRVRKREKNTAAARKYRQKRTNRIAELEAALADVTSERDELRLQLLAARTEVRTMKEGLGIRLPTTGDKSA